MRYTIALQNTRDRALIQAGVGVVIFNGVPLMPHEADMLGQALNECAGKAEDLAANAAATIAPETAEA